jgi:hypothetical protein
VCVCVCVCVCASVHVCAFDRCLESSRFVPRNKCQFVGRIFIAHSVKKYTHPPCLTPTRKRRLPEFWFSLLSFFKCFKAASVRPMGGGGGATCWGAARKGHRGRQMQGGTTEVVLKISVSSAEEDRTGTSPLLV